MIGFIMTSGRMIQQYREKEKMTNKDKQHEYEWSLEQCKKRGCLPTGEPIEALYGTGY